MTALSVAEVRWRARRDPTGGPPRVRVAFISGTGDADAAAAARVLAAIAGLAGRPRRDYDPDAVAALAGERRLGRGLAAACLDFYRWQTRSFAEALPAHVAEALAHAGVDTPSALRLRLFDLVNERYAGFVPAARRDEALAELALTLGLSSGDGPALERALTLDAEEEAVLTPLTAPPTLEDVIARYNRLVLAALLRQAERITAVMHAPSGGLVRRLYGLCRRLGVYCEVEQELGEPPAFRLVLAGPEAVAAPPAAAGPRLALATRHLLPHLGPGDRLEARLLLHGRSYRLPLDRALVRVPGLAPEAAATGERAEDEENAHFDSEVEATLARRFAALVRQGRAAGWRLVREPAPLLAGNRVLIPDFALERGTRRVFVEVVGFWTPAYLERKRRALEHLPPETPLILAVAETAAPALAGLPFPLLPYRDAVPLQQLLDLAEVRFGDFAERTRGAGARLAVACREAAGGWLSLEALSAALGCHTPGEVQRVLQEHRLPEGWTYIPGAGLCGPALRATLLEALTRHWAVAGPTARLTLTDVRALLPGVTLPEMDTALAALLARLDACTLVQTSLFEVVVGPSTALSADHDRQGRRLTAGVPADRHLSTS
jgi:predicted nuclease of restriction endonuclease-like RecB superfamily